MALVHEVFNDADFEARPRSRRSQSGKISAMNAADGRLIVKIEFPNGDTVRYAACGYSSFA